ncbi:MAG: tetratricopeptide repeat protein [Pyrinomonadaceae bacterium]|nr:tetratricopeptide repeat protein [Pyrinomonadaceae bacterium]
MKKLALISFLAAVAFGCADEKTAITANNQAPEANTSKDLAMIPSHSTEKPAEKAPMGGSPMQKPVDVAEMTAAIEKANAAFNKDPKSDDLKKELAKAYFERASALTSAAQYRAALGDFRKGLKLDPGNEEAKKMHDEIVRIFTSMNREPPKEGEEPPPMPIS